MTTKLRVGVIGAGGISRQHIKGYLDTGRFEITALADLSAAVMAEKDAQFNISPTHYIDAHEMLEQEDLDVISICTWHQGHPTWTLAAAAHKPKAILCEKPMAENLGRAAEMLVACRRHGVKLAIGNQRRFLPTYTMARDLISDGAIGQIDHLVAYGGDGLLNYCSHQADMFRYFLDDDCDWVMGNVERKSDRWERGTRIEDSALCLFHFKRGAYALILADLTPTWYQGAQIYGSDGMIQVTTTQLQLLNGDNRGKWASFEPDGKFFEVDKEGDRFEWYEGAAAQADELADWVEGKVETHRNEADNGYKAVEMLMAVYESARCHERVVLPLQTRASPLDLMVESGHLAPSRPGKYDIRSFLLRHEFRDGS